jgi:hypothetical protein
MSKNVYGLPLVPCRVGTLVSYRRVDGTCRKVNNYSHAWSLDADEDVWMCLNCGMTRSEYYQRLRVARKTGKPHVSERG